MSGSISSGSWKVAPPHAVALPRRRSSSSASFIRVAAGGIAAWEAVAADVSLRGDARRLAVIERVNMLELRPTCEQCNKALPPASLEARICTYECTFCRDCADNS